MHVDAIETARMAIYLNAVLAGHSVDGLWGDGAWRLSAVDGRAIGRDPSEWPAAFGNGVGFNVSMRWGSRYRGGLPIWFHPLHWVLKAYGMAGVTAWRPSYAIEDEPGSGRRLWLVSYDPDDGEDAPLPHRDLADVAVRLSSVLDDLVSLTGERIPGWQSKFLELSMKLEGREPADADLRLPPGVLADLPSRLVATAFAGQVFTGMGNWGDNFYDADVQPEVERMTGDLFMLLAEALSGAVDTTRPISGPRANSDREFQ